MLKNTLIQSCLILSLISCKKDKVIVTDSNGKKIELSDEKKSELEKIPNAIVDSSGIYKTQFILKKGAKFPFVSVQNDTSTQTIDKGEKIQNEEQTRDEMMFEVKDINQNIYSIDVNLLSKKITAKQGKQSIVIDTKGAQPKDNNLKLIYLVNKAMMNSVFKLKMDKYGKIISLDGFEPVYTKIITELKKTSKDPKMVDNMMQGVKQTFNPEIMTKQLEKNLNTLPKKGVKLNEKWSETEKLDPQGKIVSTTNYVLKNINEAEAEIEISGGIPLKSDKQTQQQYTQNISVEAKQTGSIIIDRKTGWVKSSALNINTTQKQSLSDGKQTQTMTMIRVSKMKIN